jgi:hypothetical protein
MVHVWKYHVNREGRVLAIATDDKHIQDLDDAWVVHCLENFDLAQGSYRHALLLIMHKNTFEGHQTPGEVVHCFVNLSKSTFAKFRSSIIVTLLATT